MIKIRYPRLAKFRKKNQKLILAIQIVAIWYIAFITIGYLTSSTGAYFTSNDIESTEIQAGYWDESKLKFIKKGNDNLNEFICPANEFEISTVIKNVGKTDMFRDGTYEVYYVENGQPSVNGSKVAEGKISKLLEGQELVLTQKVTSEGFYMFKTSENSGQKEEKVIWSEKIKVKCKASNSPEKEDKVEGEKGTTEKESVESSESSEKDDKPKVEEPKEEKAKEESKTEPESGTVNSDPNSSNQNNTVSENNNTSTVTKEEQKDNESQNN
ncbi:amyloid fiber anchoring/assembly protein TapA [Bacillus sp. sid0103]|uniref:amyloid fiber anchoring/assembly protein TapA n=1 Tax=Bacillus sp. sid0103 TaxID=2856337 RepID=UPI001C45D758|nr:amyloid fiber anchoring/assembly protein TapA [Bacillus sp. sid0103]MBV7508062.1 amyloid fiber anchoring/assembly protein TapA [Bacillus sp. sid0103]